jgi:hypothetical protein
LNYKSRLPNLIQSLKKEPTFWALEEIHNNLKALNLAQSSSAPLSTSSKNVTINSVTSQVLTINGLPLIPKGSLITSNGTQDIVLPVGNNGQVLSSDSTQISGLKWIDGSNISITVTQLNTFTKGQAIYFNGSTWVLAESNAAGTLGLAIVINATSSSFNAVVAGFITVLSGLTAGQYYYVSDATPGLLTVTEPSTVGHYSNPLFFATSTTSGFVLPFRPSAISAVAANVSLSNLSAVAINTTLLPGNVNTIALGSATLPFTDLYLGAAANKSAHFTYLLTANRAITIPDTDCVLVTPDTGVANNFLTAISGAGAISKAQPASTNLSDYGSFPGAAFGSKTANYVFAAPNGSAGNPTFRLLVSADIPNLPASIITSGQLALARGGTNADLSATGGTSNVLKQITTGANITVGQLNYSDISGTPAVGANTALSNLASVAINTTLLPGIVNTIALGSTTLPFTNLYLGTTTDYALISAPAGALTLDAGGTNNNINLNPKGSGVILFDVSADTARIITLELKSDLVDIVLAAGGSTSGAANFNISDQIAELALFYYDPVAGVIATLNNTLIYNLATGYAGVDPTYSVYGDLSVILNAWEVLGGGLRVSGVINAAATKGEGIEIGYDPATHIGLVQAYDRVGSAMKWLALGAPASAVTVANLGPSQVSVSIDESLNTLKFTVKYSNGTTTKTGTVALL